MVPSAKAATSATASSVVWARSATGAAATRANRKRTSSATAAGHPNFCRDDYEGWHQIHPERFEWHDLPTRRPGQRETVRGQAGKDPWQPGRQEQYGPRCKYSAEFIARAG